MSRAGFLVVALLVPGASAPSSAGPAAPPEPVAASAPLARPAPDGPTPAERAAAAFDEARRMLDGNLPAQARETALEGLAWAPYDVAGYRVLADLAETVEDTEDLLRWGKWQYWAHRYSGRKSEAAEVAAKLQSVYPGWNRDEEILATWRAAVERAIRYAGGSGKQFLVAGHLMAKLRALDPADEDLARQAEKLFEKAGEAVTGGAFTAAKVRNRSASWLAKQNGKHKAWEDAYQRKTKHYRIVTNISYEFFETVSVVMEDMFDFYQQVYGYSGRAPTVTLAIHRRRSDFDRYCQQELRGSLPLGVGGWFYDQEMTVAAYDRTESGRDLSDLWETLFHEASHQFMYLLTTKKTKQDPPTWLNEGTASYFEGCELKADGSIVKNKPALGRLREWEYLEKSDQKHTLEQLVTCSHASYGGSYYSYGWGFVYFLNNYEDESGERIYREPYLKYLESYTKKSRRDEAERGREAFERAQEYFIADVGDPKVKTWDDLEVRWRTWMQALVKESKSGPELADTLQQRCRTALAKEDFERALIAAEQADDKRPEDPETYRLLANACAGLDREGDGVFWMLRHWEAAWADGDEEAMAAAETWLGRNGGKDLVENYCAPTRELEALTIAAMETADDEEHPSAAMLYGCHALQAVGLRNAVLLERIETLRAESALDLRLWQVAYAKDESANRKWDGVDVVKYEPDGVLVNNPKGPGRPREDCDAANLGWLEPPYDVRGVVEVDGKAGGYLYLGIGSNGRARSAVNFLKTGRVDLENVDLDVDVGGTGISITSHSVVKSEETEPVKKLPFLLEARPDGGKLEVGSEKKLTIEFPKDWGTDRLTGHLGLSAGDDSVALFTEVAIRPSRPFWPVEALEID